MTDVCVYQLENNAGMKDNHGPQSDDCGAHAMTIVGIRKSPGGKCEVHIRNSWGEGWPVGGQEKGYAWIDVDAYLKSLDRHVSKDSYGRMEPNIPSLISIATRAQDAPIQNTIVSANRVAIGQTTGFGLDGQGTQEFNTPQGKLVEKGLFKNGNLISGEKHLENGQVLIGTFNSAGNLSGEGTATSSDGREVKGTFEAGRLVRGVQKFSDGQISAGTFDASGNLNGVGSLKTKTGDLEEGTFAKNELVSGKLTLANGPVMEGTFENGRLTKGIYRFAADSGPAGFFSGTMAPGGIFLTGWAKNMPGITVGGEAGFLFTGKLDTRQMKCGLAKKGSKAFCFNDSGTAFPSDVGTYAACHCEAFPASLR